MHTPPSETCFKRHSSIVLQVVFVLQHMQLFDFMSTTANWYLRQSDHDCYQCGSVRVFHLGVRQFPPQNPAALAFSSEPRAQCQDSFGTTHWCPFVFFFQFFSLPPTAKKKKNKEKSLPRGNCLCLLFNLLKRKERLLISTLK